MTNSINIPGPPFAVFDEFGKPADDRVQDYAASCVSAALAAQAQQPDPAEMEAQLRHLVEDMTWCPNPDDPTRKYIRPGAGLLFSNMVHAVERLLASKPECTHEGTADIERLWDQAAADGEMPDRKKLLRQDQSARDRDNTMSSNEGTTQP
jgi:hypothetical protein